MIIVLCGVRGCIAEGMHVSYVLRDEDGRRQNDKGGSIDRLFHRFNGIPMRGKGNYAQPKTRNARYFAPCMDDRHRIVMGEVEAVLASGTKPCVRVTTTSGLSVVCTPDHPFATLDGYIEAHDLVTGSAVLTHRNIRAGGAGKRKPQIRRPQVYVKQHPHAPIKVIRTSSGDYEYRRLARARAIYEASMNGLTLEAFVTRLNNVGPEGLIFLEAGLNVHHKDENPLNDDPENLEPLLHKEHASQHGLDHEELRFLATEDKIARIERVGDLPTYDIRMTGRPHNFVVEGFVVHNSGKDTIGDILVKNHGFTKEAFANPLKAMVRHAFPAFTDADLYGPSKNREREYKQYPFSGECLSCGFTCQKIEEPVGTGWVCPACGRGFSDYVSPRTALQQLGTEFGRRLCRNVWIDACFERITKSKLNARRWDPVLQAPDLSTFETNHVITDGRFLNETRRSRELGGFAVKLTRGMAESTDPHPSEAELRTMPESEFDFVFDNAVVGLDALPEMVSRLYARLKEKT